ncbi:hypothetical protein HOE37_02765 [Candidatus Woesearchaeota archaeon]|mgnify:CR=1 FL=1|jgi:hypothetical protein|nr:hypothetical protein [Candidatus Woesearchaeota archaeon]
MNDEIPVFECVKRKDFLGGLQFFCPFCKALHKHGMGEGHRIAHCFDQRSPYTRTGYILKLKNGMDN